jgi:hypothetical protein
MTQKNRSIWDAHMQEWSPKVSSLASGNTKLAEALGGEKKVPPPSKDKSNPTGVEV